MLSSRFRQVMIGKPPADGRPRISVAPASASSPMTTASWNERASTRPLAAASKKRPWKDDKEDESRELYENVTDADNPTVDPSFPK
jgi:hypothetical protein